MSAPVSPLQPSQEPLRRCKHDVSEDCPACAEETIASLKARVEELEAKTALVTFNEACKRIEELEAALRFIADGYDNHDINHVDYRVKVYQVALDVLGEARGSGES